MNRLALILAAALLTAVSFGQYYPKPDAPVPGSGRVAADGRMAGVRVDQKLKDFVPLDLPFTNEKGESVPLSSVFGKRPVLLLPIFYSCSGICTQELNGLINALNAFKRPQDQPGETFDVLIVSIDPKENAKMAAEKKTLVMEEYNRKGTEEGWHFWVGSQENVAKLMDSVGFVYRIDSKNGNIVHPAALIALTPKGQISKYFLDSEYEQKPLLIALRDAAENKVGEKDQKPFFMACINIDPITGAVSVNVLNLLKTLGILTVLALITSIIVMNRKYKQSMDLHGGGAA